MASKEQAQQLKDKRSRLKAKITSAAKLLMSSTTNLTNIDQAFSSLEDSYSSFLECHYELLEFTDGDDSIDPVVAGLDMDAYLCKVQGTYQEAKQYFIETKIQTLSIDVNSATDKADYYIKEFQSDTAVITSSCLDSASALTEEARQLLKELSSLNSSSSLFSKLSNHLCELDRALLGARQKHLMGSVTANHPSRNISSDNPALRLSDMHSLTLTGSPHSHAAGLGESGSGDTGQGHSSGVGSGGVSRGGRVSFAGGESEARVRGFDFDSGDQVESTRLASFGPGISSGGFVDDRSSSFPS